MNSVRLSEQYLNEWLEGKASGMMKGGQLSKIVRKFILRTRGEACEICGWAEVHPITGKVPVEINHKDGDASNNRPENLEVLCPNHHSLTASFRGLNRGRGRPNRMPLKHS